MTDRARDSDACSTVPDQHQAPSVRRAGQRGSGGQQRLGKIIGNAGRSVGVGHYFASADYQTLYRQFGITAAAVAAAAWDSIHDAQDGTRPGGHPVTFAPAAGGTADRPRSGRPEHDQ